MYKIIRVGKTCSGPDNISFVNDPEGTLEFPTRKQALEKKEDLESMPQYLGHNEYSTEYYIAKPGTRCFRFRTLA